jgi:hypothetical protein
VDRDPRQDAVLRASQSRFAPPGRPIDRHASPQLTAGASMVSVFVVGNVLWFNATVSLLYFVSLAIVA